MREGLLDAWRQRASAQQDARRELSTHALVGFLTLVLIMVVVYGSVSVDSTKRLESLQSLSAQAFKLQAPAMPFEAQESLPELWQIDALEGVDGIRIHRSESQLSVLIENDVLFFPGTADTREAVELWWPRLVQGLAELDRPLLLGYFQQWETPGPEYSDRRILAQQAAMLGRLLTAEQLTIEQLDIVDSWVSPDFDDSGGADDEAGTAGAVLLMIEVQLVSPVVE